MSAGDKVTSRQLLRCITPQALTQSSGPEDGRNYRPKHVELIDITNKLLLLRLVGCLYYCILEVLRVQLRNHRKLPSCLIFLTTGDLHDCDL